MIVAKSLEERNVLVDDLIDHAKRTNRLVMWSPRGKKEVKRSYYEREIDMATMASWWYRNPESGFTEFYSNTPDWIMSIAMNKYGIFRGKGSVVKE